MTMSYEPRCMRCEPPHPGTIMRDVGWSGIRCGRCLGPMRWTVRADLAYEAPPELLPHEKQALADWAMRHADEVEAPGLTETEAARCRFVKHLMQTGKVTP